MRYAACLVGLLLGLAAAGQAGGTEESTAFGFWLNPDQGWVVETSACGAALCGKLVGFRQTQSPDYVAIDRHNPDPKKRSRPLCGLVLLGSFTPSPKVAGKWDHGWVYDPDTGKTYSGEAQMIGSDTIELRGYILFPLFGRTLTLVRETGRITRCSVSPPG